MTTQEEEMVTGDSTQDPGPSLEAAHQEVEELINTIRRRLSSINDGVSNLTRECATATLRTATLLRPQLLHQLEVAEVTRRHMDSLVVLGQEKIAEQLSLAEDDNVDQLISELDDLILYNEDSQKH